MISVGINLFAENIIWMSIILSCLFSPTSFMVGASQQWGALFSALDNWVGFPLRRRVVCPVISSCWISLPIFSSSCPFPISSSLALLSPDSWSSSPLPLLFLLFLVFCVANVVCWSVSFAPMSVTVCWIETCISWVDGSVYCTVHWFSPLPLFYLFPSGLVIFLLLYFSISINGEMIQIYLYLARTHNVRLYLKDNRADVNQRHQL